MSYSDPNGPAYGQPPPPPAYTTTGPGGAPPPPPGTVVYTQQPGVMIAQSNFHMTPVRMRCPHCQSDITTTTTYVNGTMTWVSCGVLALVGCWLGCCLIPFCLSATKDVIHICPSCMKEVGRFDRMR